MKKALKKATALIITMATLLSIMTVPSHAGVSKISDNSADTVTFTIYTKAKLYEFANMYPAKITLTQTKGTRIYIDENGNRKTSLNNEYCWYDIDYKVYDNKGKYQFSGHDDFTTASKTIKLRAGCIKAYKYVVTIKPHHAYVYNKQSKKYYLGYVWTNPSKWTVTPTHDITDMWISSVSKNK